MLIREKLREVYEMHKRIVRILLIMVLVMGMTVVAGCRKQDSKEMETPDVTVRLN